jgi:hypothetical protein
MPRASTRENFKKFSAVGVIPNSSLILKEIPNMNSDFVGLHGGCSRNGDYFDIVDAFFALAEAGGSLQAKYVREELSKVDDYSKRGSDPWTGEKCFSPNNWNTHDRINAALESAYQTCLKEAYRNDLSRAAAIDMTYDHFLGWDIIVRRHPRIWITGERIVRSLYQFFWTAYQHSLGQGRPDPTRYVQVELVGYILTLRGRPVDVVELAKQAKLFEILPRLWMAGAETLDEQKLVEYELVPQERE